ncbi:MAG: endonuclease, partial [Candidatus Omnitrophica bacterium CG12_big_fil_rev_8_21_14_0_65_50_5]
MHLRVMTYNVRHCRTFWGTVRTEQFAEVIREYNVDIVGMQE